PQTRPDTPRRSSPSIVPWVVTGIGVAELAAGGILGVVTLGKVSALEDKCPSDTCPANSGFESDVSSARGFVRATDYLLLGGGIVTVAGVPWLVVSRSGRAEHAGLVQPRRWHVGIGSTKIAF